MNNNVKYVIDTCSLTILRRDYPKYFARGAWDAVSELTDNGVIISSYEIFLELKAQEDEIYQWAREHQKMFLPLEEEIQKQAIKILADYPNLIDHKKNKSSADPFLIATAMVHSAFVVTEETPSGPGAKFIKIPNVCKGLGIRCIKFLDVMKAEKVLLLRA